MSPELFKYKPYNYKSDIWALGCVMYEICNLKHAFNAQTLHGLALKILKGNCMPISTKYSQKLRDLVMSMLNVNPKKRPSIFEIIERPEIKKRVVNYVLSLHRLASSNRESSYQDLYLEQVMEQCKVLGIDEMVKQGLVGKSMHLSQLKKSTNLGKSSSLLQKQKQKKEQQLLTSKKRNENISKKIAEIEAKLRNRAGKMPTKDKVLYNKQMKKLKEIRDRQQELEQFREQNDKERKNAKEKFMKNFQSNAVGEVLHQQQQDKNDLDELNDSGYDEFAEADYGYEGFPNDSNIGPTEPDYDISSEIKLDSPAKPNNPNAISNEGQFKEDTNINNLPDDELEVALDHYKALLRSNADNIQKLETDIKLATKQLNSNDRNDHQDYEDDIDAVSQDTPFNVSDLEESDSDNEYFSHEKQSSKRNLGKVFENKIKDLEMRCINGLGEEIYKQGYEIVKSNHGLSPEEMRPYMSGKPYTIYLLFNLD